MRKIILAVNAGSSSVRVSIFAAEPDQFPVQLAEAQVSGLTSPPAKLKYLRNGEVIVNNRAAEEFSEEGGHKNVTDQNSAFNLILSVFLSDPDLPDLPSRDSISLVCHRIVHGGDYARPQLITDDTLHHLEDLADLAPLHNAPALEIVRWCIDELSPPAKNIACFDSQFHATIPEHIRTYAINPEVARKKGLRKYGFHGISYSFITRAVAEYLGKDRDKVNMIALHLGSGASACAIKAGKSWDTSMGLTPLAGLPGATRSGTLDPSLVFHYTSNVSRLSHLSTSHLHLTRAEAILNLDSGWKALTGTTDFGTITKNRDSNPSMRLAFDLFANRVANYIGSYYVALEGKVDALVFAGGIGERSAELRREIVKLVGCLGFEIDEERNEQIREEGVVVWDVGKEGENEKLKRVLVCRTDEQFEMVRMCMEEEGVW